MVTLSSEPEASRAKGKMERGARGRAEEPATNAGSVSKRRAALIHMPLED